MGITACEAYHLKKRLNCPGTKKCLNQSCSFTGYTGTPRGFDFAEGGVLPDGQNKSTVHEPMPNASGEKQTVVVDELVKDLQARVEVGKIKYGESLKSHNGRNCLMDAYQEVLDLAMYFKQLLIEQRDELEASCNKQK